MVLRISYTSRRKLWIWKGSYEIMGLVAWTVFVHDSYFDCIEIYFIHVEGEIWKIKCGKIKVELLRFSSMYIYKVFVCEFKLEWVFCFVTILKYSMNIVVRFYCWSFVHVYYSYYYKNSFQIIWVYIQYHINNHLLNIVYL